MTKETIKDAQKKTLTAMANVNAVDGFDPRLVTSCFQDAEGNNRMYLQAEPAMLWFRLKHPGGRLEQIVYRANDQMATVEGRVIDENGNLLANAFATRYHSDDQFGKDYIQNAGTAAIRKALGNCGFGTPADAEYIEDVTTVYKTTADLPDAPVDGGVLTNFPVPPVPQQLQDKVKEKEKEPDPKTDVPAAKKTVKKAAPKAAPTQVEEKVDEPVKPVAAPVQNTFPVPPVPAANPTPDNEPMTLEKALAFKVMAGRFAGQTMKEMMDSGNGGAISYFLRPQYNGKPIQAAARLIAGQYNL